VDERPRYVPIVREPDVRRLAAATRAVLAEFDRLRELVGHRPEILAHLYAGGAVRADDDHGRSAGLVIQADELRWSELDELVRLADAQLQPGQHAGLDTWHPGCSDCQAVLAIARIRARHRYRTVGPSHPAAGSAGPASDSGPAGPGSPAGSASDASDASDASATGQGRRAGPVSGSGSPAEGGTATPGRGPP
jgi:hypothetical protein